MLAAVLFAHAGASAADAVDLTGRVRAAIADAVRQRLGADADVAIDDLDCDVAGDPGGPLLAIPETGARGGRDARFTIVSHTAAGASVRRLGRASATLTISALFLRTTRPLPGGHLLAPGDVSVERGVMTGVALHRLVRTNEIDGARTTHDIASGAIVSSADVAIPPLVRAGDQVQAFVRFGSVEAVMLALAVETGGADRVIRIVNPRTRKAMRARVVGARQVEVVDEY